MEKIALISTYPPYKCAIAIYEKHLAQALRAESNATLFVISEGGVQHCPEISVVDAYKRSGDFGSDILGHVARIRPDIVHFQHAPDLFPDNERFIALLAGIARHSARLFITLHTVYENRKYLSFYKRAGKFANFIVHNTHCRDVLDQVVGSECSIHVIPHGTESLDLPDAAQSRNVLGLSGDCFVFLFFGAIHVMKNLHTVVLAFHEVAQKKERAHLLIAGRPWRDRVYNRAYVSACKLLSGYGSRYHWHDHYIENSLVNKYIAAADVLLLPYWQKYHSSSGVFHMAMGAGKPVLCSDSPKFCEVGPGFASEFPVFLPTHAVGQWARAMMRIMDDEHLRTAVSAALSEHGAASTWRTVAQRHIEAFRQA